MKILICDGLEPQGLEILKGAQGLEVNDESPISREALKGIIENYHALVVRSRTVVDAEIMKLGKRLLAIGRAGTGVDNIDVDEATQRGVLVMNTPGANALAAAEHTIALMLALTRHIPQAVLSMREGRWDKKRFMGTEVNEQTLGIIGLGNVGKLVAERAVGLKMKVVAYDPYLPVETARRAGVEMVDLKSLFACADFITLHSPLTQETRNLINRETLSTMKKGVRIINCARGGIVNEDDLYEALISGHVGGAALDVFSQEPPAADHALLKLPQVITTPHLGASSEQSQVKVATTIAQQIVDYLQRGIIKSAVNLPAGAFKDMEHLTSYLDLSQRLGRFVSQAYGETIERVDIQCSGNLADYDVSLLKNGVLKGLLDPILTESVNLVNSPVAAHARGMQVFEHKSSETQGYSGLITLTVHSGSETFSVAGTVFGKDDLRIVRVNEFVTETRPWGNILLSYNYDRPGVIGNLGTTLGRHEINISKMHLARNKLGDRAIALVKIDQPVSEEIIEELRALPNIIMVKQIRL
jgi:D-3-phosphoglycerate dehydrogenase